MRKLLSNLYRLITGMRNCLYDAGMLPVRRADVPVVSIGNIEVGGTGKTPFTIALARELSARGYRPVIVTRGYKGRLKGIVHVRPDHDFRDVGDEALFMARTSGVPVVKSPDRFRGAMYARSGLKADLVLLDDGFQHRRCHRDLDIVLVSGDVSREALLPSGRLRESADSLRRADIIVYTKGSGGGGVTAELIPSSLLDGPGGTRDLSLLRGKRVLAVSGIARPDHFIRSLHELGARTEALTFRDHYAYTSRDIEKIKARAKDCDLIVTTEKDMVRMKPAWLDAKWLALKVEMCVTGMEGIIREIDDIVKGSGVPRQG
ncbi:MAG TPA: tetraacyldisaccharide 4'-kinase [Deltaproteobacteria bacterium]|jgi:tetraacyldisaccharide 4'-kinase|nr:tetraacyldisaccharide 4'-kinase [Deltaproteobacteria bacterium]HQI02032.1 tetraacyldisaccharide 4'-kinase [Deltaproteobacteria bacterium]